jgi:uncharacterized protein YbcI
VATISGDSVGRQKVGAEIAREISQVHADSYGAGVCNIDVQLGERFIALMMDIELTPAERTLVSGGREDSVRISREAYQLAIEPTFRAIVERASGRRVEGFASRTVLEQDAPSWSAEIFRLSPG